MPIHLAYFAAKASIGAALGIAHWATTSLLLHGGHVTTVHIVGGHLGGAGTGAAFHGAAGAAQSVAGEVSKQVAANQLAAHPDLASHVQPAAQHLTAHAHVFVPPPSVATHLSAQQLEELALSGLFMAGSQLGDKKLKEVLKEKAPQIAAEVERAQATIAERDGQTYEESIDAGSLLEEQIVEDVQAIHGAIVERAKQISELPGAGTDLENWVRAERQILTQQRAEEIAASAEAGSDLDNWLRAELEVVTALRARALADANPGRSDIDNWLAAEAEARIQIRAEEIARHNPDGSPEDNWYQAERELSAT